MITFKRYMLLIKHIYISTVSQQPWYILIKSFHIFNYTGSSSIQQWRVFLIPFEVNISCGFLLMFCSVSFFPDVGLQRKRREKQAINVIGEHLARLSATLNHWLPSLYTYHLDFLRLYLISLVKCNNGSNLMF